jgi:hypothetical protein
MIGAIVPNIQPTKTASISIDRNSDEIRVTVGDFGQVVVKPLRGLTGQLTRLVNGAGAFGQDIVLGSGAGTRWSDPEMRQWEGGHADMSEFDWSG